MFKLISQLPPTSYRTISERFPHLQTNNVRYSRTGLTSTVTSENKIHVTNSKGEQIVEIQGPGFLTTSFGDYFSTQCWFLPNDLLLVINVNDAILVQLYDIPNQKMLVNGTYKSMETGKHTTHSYTYLDEHQVLIIGDATQISAFYINENGLNQIPENSIDSSVAPYHTSQRKPFSITGKVQEFYPFLDLVDIGDGYFASLPKEVRVPGDINFVHIWKVNRHESPETQEFTLTVDLVITISTQGEPGRNVQKEGNIVKINQREPGTQPEVTWNIETNQEIPVS